MRLPARMILDIRNIYSTYSLTVMYMCDRNTYYYQRMPCSDYTILIPGCTSYCGPNYPWWFVVIQEFRRRGCTDSSFSPPRAVSYQIEGARFVSTRRFHPNIIAFERVGDDLGGLLGHLGGAASTN